MKDVDVAALLRTFAKEARSFRFKSADAYVEQMDSFARKMERKASDLVHPAAVTSDDPAFFFPGNTTVRGRSVRVERRRSKIAA